MFRPNALKHRLLAGKRALGCWTVLGTPPVIELPAYCGFDYLLLDQQHGFGESSALLHSLPNYLKRVLDAGVEGVRVPNVETAEEARAVVAACRYPPRGRRGSALGSAWGSITGFVPDGHRAPPRHYLARDVPARLPHDQRRQRCRPTANLPAGTERMPTGAERDSRMLPSRPKR